MADGKIVLKGIIRLVSSALIGSGNDERSDCDVILDAEGKPFIPATSLIGVLQHNIKPDKMEAKLKKFWGYTEGKDSLQSCLLCSDLYLKNDAKIIIRDGIKIDNKNGMVEFDKVRNTGKKYDYQVIDRGAEFGLKIVISFSDATKDFCKQMAATILDALKNKKIRIGAKTNSGLGKIELVSEALQEYSFYNKEDVFKWLIGIDGNPFTETAFNIKKPVFTINATLQLKNSFIIRSYAEDAKAPDSTSIKSGDDFVITGTALKGAIRSRAEKIAKTIKPDIAQQIIDDLFGYVDENNSNSKAKKGRVRIDEVILPRFCTELQSRIKIDRFTGGVLEGALFDSMPLFSRKEEIENFNIEIVNCEEYEAGLLLLVLKDLWTGDLAVGGEKNVGRGVFEGVKAVITWDDDEKASLKKGDLSDLSNLTHFVESLNNLKEVVNDKK